MTSIGNGSSFAHQLSDCIHPISYDWSVDVIFAI